MIIRGEVTNGEHSIPIHSMWEYNPDDPWAITVSFLESSAVWNFSLDLFMDAFTAPADGLHGAGDVLVEITEETALIHLSNGTHTGTLKFSADKIRDFLNEVDAEDPDEVVARELDEFLGAL